MERVQISVDLNENELLQKSVREAVKSTARKIAREAIDKALSAEINRVTSARVKDWEESRYSGMGLVSQVRKAVDEAVTKKLQNIIVTDAQVTESIQSCIENRLGNSRVSDYLENQIAVMFTTYTDNKLDSLITERVMLKLANPQKPVPITHPFSSFYVINLNNRLNEIEESFKNDMNELTAEKLRTEKATITNCISMYYEYADIHFHPPTKAEEGDCDKV